MQSQPTAIGADARPAAIWLAAGFVGGGLGVLVFHQGAAWVLHSMGLTPNPPFPQRPTWPFGVPQIWSLAFWGGVWGIGLAMVLRSVKGVASFWLIAFAFGALGPSLVSWFVVAPLRGVAPAGGWQLPVMARGLLLNGIFGLGTAVCLCLTRRFLGR